MQNYHHNDCYNGLRSSFITAMHKDNFYGVQFHAEKSAMASEQILSNFLKIIMELIPAIDIISGKCVRLTRGITTNR